MSSTATHRQPHGPGKAEHCRRRRGDCPAGPTRPAAAFATGCSFRVAVHPGHHRATRRVLDVAADDHDDHDDHDDDDDHDAATFVELNLLYESGLA
jgi:hypothetical protein